MARLFANSSGTDKVDYGSPAVLDNLSNSGAMTVLVVGRRTADTGNLALATKSNSTANGWEFYTDLWPSGTTYGHLMVIIWRATARTQRMSGSADTSADTMVLNQHEIVGFTWDGTTIKFYRNKLETPIAEVAGYNTIQAGSGTPGTDAADNYYGWNSQRSANPFTGDGAFQLVYNRVLTTAEMQTVHLGVLAYRAAIEAGGSTTRAVNIWKSVSGYVLLAYVAADGTLTDHSGNGNNGTLTGTTSGTELSNVFCPTAFEEDNEANAPTDIREQTTYRYVSSQARKGFTTTATGFTAWMITNLDRTYAAQANLAYLIDGAYTGELASSATGINAVAVTGLSGSSKNVHFQNNVRSRNPNLPGENTSFAVVIFSASATEITPPTRTKLLMCYADSLYDGFRATPVAQKGALQQIRLALPATYDGLLQESYGGRQLHHDAVDATARAKLITQLTTLTRRDIFFAIGHNDWAAVSWTVSAFQTALAATMDDLLAVSGFTGRIYLLDPITYQQEGTTNGNGETMDQFRTAIRAVASGRPRVSYLPMKTILTFSGDFEDDAHPNNSGSDKLYTYLGNVFHRPLPKPGEIMLAA